MRKLVVFSFLFLIASTSMAQTLVFDLKQIRQAGSYCEMIVDIKNNTNLNITSMAAYLLFREGNGSVIDSAMTSFFRVRPNSITTDKVSLSNVNCNLVKAFQFKEVWGSVISIDGDQKFGRPISPLIDGIRVTSSIRGIAAKN